MTGEHELAELNRPDERYDHSDPRRWIVPATFVEVPSRPAIEQVSYYHVPAAPPALPPLVPREPWCAALKATERKPFEVRLRQASDTAAEHARRVQVATADYAKYITREVHARLEAAKAELQGAELDLDIARRQLEQFDARDRQADLDRAYDKYVAAHEARVARELVLDRTRQAGDLLAGCVKELRAFDTGNYGSRRQIQEALIGAWQRAGLHPADLRDLIRS